MTFRIFRALNLGLRFADIYGLATCATSTTQIAITRTTRTGYAIIVVRTGLTNRTTGRANRAARIALLPQESGVNRIGGAVEARNVTANGFARAAVALGIDRTGFAFFTAT